MHVLIAIAFKSLLLAGLTLGLLALMKKRSAAERSWVAHIGLLALVIMALAPLVLPSWNVEAPSLLGEAPAIEAPAQAAAAPAPATDLGKLAKPDTTAATVQPTIAEVAPAGKGSSLSAVAAATAIYAIPAAILLFITFLALGRLIALRARADVLVDGHWLSALARAQRRMGFKHGTALLTSNELASPISWGLMRPVILLNSRAVEASGEAEAIIAHELAHVARMDWVKLLLARVATALFWFNPFVWLLAREAHQLREETADDAVLAADIPDTDYAQLLVGVARHDCPSMLLGAHGVAPSRSSLARRVARVLDGTSVRGPAARGFAAGVFAGAVLVAAPLAALTLTPKGTVAAEKAAKAAGAEYKGDGAAYYAGADAIPSDLPSIIGQGVATSVQSAVAAINPNIDDADFETVATSGASVKRVNGVTTARAPSGATVTVYPPDASGRRKVIAISATGARAVSYADADDDIPGFGPDRRHEPKSVIEQAIEMKAVGVTSEYMSAMKAASPALRDTDPDDFVGMKAVGVTPDYIRGLASVGFANLDADELTEARAVGVTADFIRSMRAAGYNGDLDDFVEMRAVGITPGYAQKFKKSGYNVSLKKLVDLKAKDVDLDDLRAPPRPPQPPRPPSNLPDGN
jgi:beta-lactamase regulating signal transducer with metallopeptidase domain